MRIALLAALVLTACSKEAPPPPPDTSGLKPGLFFSNERDALCIVGVGKVQRAGFITFAEDNANCSATGTVVRDKSGWALRPSGDEECRIPLEVSANVVTLGAGAEACAYYCAPGLTFAGKSFSAIESARGSPKDLAGDDLC